jgi:hypothetical protein
MLFLVDSQPNQKVQVGGFADRIKGITSLYLLGLLIDEPVTIAWRQPEPLSIFYESTVVNFEDEQHFISPSTVSFIDQRGIELNNRLSMVLENQGIDAVRACVKEQVGGKEIIANQWLPILSSPSLLSFWPNAIQQALIKENDLGKQAGAVFAHCFQLKQQLPLSFRLWRHNSHGPCIGLHGRFGGNSVSWSDPAMADQEQALASLTRLVKNDNEKCWFVCSDSEAFKRQAQAVLLNAGYCSFAFNEPIHHVDRSGEGDLWSTVQDFEALRQCSAIYCTAGGFSRLAAGASDIEANLLME